MSFKIVHLQLAENKKSPQLQKMFVIVVNNVMLAIIISNNETLNDRNCSIILLMFVITVPFKSQEKEIQLKL